MIYHYTPLASIQSILQKDCICLWATNYRNLGDSLEFVWAKEFIIPEMKDIANQWKFNFDPDFNAYPYTISFCKIPDNLTLWKLYANNGNGIQLCFDETELEEFAKNYKGYPDVIQACIYADKNNLESQIVAAYKIYQQQYGSENAPLNDLQEVCAFIKSEAYKVEEEVRYCSFNYDKIDFSPENIEGTESEDTNNIKFRVRNNELVAYKDISFPKTTLKEITIGYALDFDKTRNNLLKLLSANGYNTSEIIIKESHFKSK